MNYGQPETGPAYRFRFCFLDICIRTIQLKHEGWGACFWTTASQDICLFKWLWRLNVLSHLGHFSSTLTGFGSCFIMCLFSFEGCAATKSHWVQFKECWSSVDWNLPMWPSLVFTTLIWTLWVVWMCFSKNSALFNVLSFYCTGFRTCFYQCALSSDVS